MERRYNKYDRRPTGKCEHCDKLTRLNAIYAPHSADVMLRLCDECKDKREQALEQMYAGE